MSGVNKVILVGNLCADPEVKFTPGGKAVCELRVATNETWRDKDGKKQEKAEFHRCVAWEKTAENCGKYLTKGRQVYIEGKLQTRTWEDQNGSKRYATEIVVRDIQFLGGGAGASGAGRSGARQSEPDAAPDFDDSDIPF